MNDMLKDPDFIFCAAVVWPSLIGVIIYCVLPDKSEGAKQAQFSGKDNNKKSEYADALPEYKHITVADIEKMTLQQMEAVTKEQRERLPKDMQIIFTRELNKAILAKKQKDNK